MVWFILSLTFAVFFALGLFLCWWFEPKWSDRFELTLPVVVYAPGEGFVETEDCCVDWH